MICYKTVHGVLLKSGNVVANTFHFIEDAVSILGAGIPMAGRRLKRVKEKKGEHSGETALLWRRWRNKGRNPVFFLTRRLLCSHNRAMSPLSVASGKSGDMATRVHGEPGRACREHGISRLSPRAESQSREDPRDFLSRDQRKLKRPRSLFNSWPMWPENEFHMSTHICGRSVPLVLDSLFRNPFGCGGAAR